MKCARAGCLLEARFAARLVLDLQHRQTGALTVLRVFVGIVTCPDHKEREERQPENLFVAGLDDVVVALLANHPDERCPKRGVEWVPVEGPDFAAYVERVRARVHEGVSLPAVPPDEEPAT